MQAFPHHYVVSASSTPDDQVVIEGNGLEVLHSAPPAQFGGPGDRWSPEDLLAAAVADCFILTFRAVARASNLEWQALNCTVDAVLDRPEKTSFFTEFHLSAQLTVPPGTDDARARRLLEKAEQGCLITNSLKSTIHLEASVVQAA